MSVPADSPHSLGFPLQIRDVVNRDGTSVGGADAADVVETDEVGNTHQAHTSTIQIQMSEMHVFQELDAW